MCQFLQTSYELRQLEITRSNCPEVDQPHADPLAEYLFRRTWRYIHQVLVHRDRACPGQRAAIQRGASVPEVLSKPLSSVMTPNPICIRDDALAVEALKIFNERNIDDLIVVNAKREPVGLVDSQDLPKLKIM